MTTTQIAEAIILHLCRFTMLNVSAHLAFFKRSQGALQNSYSMVVYEIGTFWN